MKEGNLTQELIRAGFIPGEDFSFYKGNLMITHEVQNYILDRMNPENREHVQTLFGKREDDPWQKIEDHLGVPFFENLKQIVSERIPTLTDEEAVHYLYHILQGFNEKYPEIGQQFAHWLIPHAISLNRWESIQDLIDQDKEVDIDESHPCFTFWITDLIKACGGEHYIIKRENDEEIFHEDGIHLLEQVYRGNLLEKVYRRKQN